MTGRPDRGAAPAGVRLVREGRVARLTLDRPPLNVLDIAAFEAMGTMLDGLAGQDGPDILVIEAAGENAFCAGADVADHTPDRAPAMIASFHRVARAIWSLPAVSVAAVHGTALGGGMELAACCDLILASETARFGQPEIKVGCFPPIAAAILPDLVGSPRAADLILTGRTVTAGEAHAMGLVSRVVPAASFDDALGALIGDLAGHSGAVTRLAVRAVRGARAASRGAALAVAERIYLSELLGLPDAREGVEAFLEKRQPRWSDVEKREEKPDR